MALDIRIVDYFNIFVWDEPKEVVKILSKISNAGINLLAFKATDTEPYGTQLTIFPDDNLKMINTAKEAGLIFDGPHPAVLIKSNSDEAGDCAGVFEKLSQADIYVTEACGIADLYGSYGIILYLKQEECEKAINYLNNPG